MTVTLDIPTTLEATVEANAWAKGVSIERYLLTLVERDFVVPPPPPGSENWTLQDALDYAGPLPENLGRATAIVTWRTLTNRDREEGREQKEGRGDPAPTDDGVGAGSPCPPSTLCPPPNPSA